jgi:hypothetical protein
MKTVLTSLIVFMLSGVSWIANLEREVAGDETQSVLVRSSVSPGAIIQDETQSVIEVPGLGSELGPVQVTPLPSVQQPFNGGESLMVEDQLNFKPLVQQPFVQQPFVQQSFAPAFCTTCRARTCRCQPDPLTVTVFCLTDPCGRQHEACIEVPACCALEQPTVSWKGNLFGRQVACLCWDCCEYEAKVVISRNGKIRVRS